MTLEGRTHQTAVQYLKNFSWSVMGGQVLNAVNILTYFSLDTHYVYRISETLS